MGLFGSIGGAIGSGKASAAAQKGYKQAREEYEKTYAGQQAMLSPWTQAESSGLSRFLQETQAGGRLDPMAQYSMQDYYSSPEYQIYQQAQNAAMQQSMDQMKAMGAAGRYGGFGGGTFANALTQNIGQLYAQYGPQALAASRQAWEGQRANALNTMWQMSRPEETNMMSQYLATKGANVAGTRIGQAQAKAQGIMGKYTGWGNAIDSAVQMGAAAYGAGMFGGAGAGGGALSGAELNAQGLGAAGPGGAFMV